MARYGGARQGEVLHWAVSLLDRTDSRRLASRPTRRQVKAGQGEARQALTRRGGVRKVASLLDRASSHRRGLRRSLGDRARLGLALLGVARLGRARPSVARCGPVPRLLVP